MSYPSSGYEYFSLQLTYCSNAASYLNYTDTNCETDIATIQVMFGFKNIKFDTKFIGQYFDPVQYHHNKTMNYYSNNDMLWSLSQFTSNEET